MRNPNLDKLIIYSYTIIHTTWSTFVHTQFREPNSQTMKKNTLTCSTALEVTQKDMHSLTSGVKTPLKANMHQIMHIIAKNQIDENCDL